MTYPVSAAANSSMPNRKIPAPPIKKWDAAAESSEFVLAKIVTA